MLLIGLAEEIVHAGTDLPLAAEAIGTIQQEHPGDRGAVEILPDYVAATHCYGVLGGDQSPQGTCTLGLLAVSKITVAQDEQLQNGQ